MLAPVALLLGACVPDVDIARDTTLSGHVTAKTFHVRPGIVVTVDDDLIVDSQGPAIIEGVMRGEIGTGADIVIRVSTGDCVVDGRIEGGSGADGEDPGEDGAAGGSVRLRADRGEVRVHGLLEAGEGGEGAGRREQGLGDLRVVSGAGGAGGDVELLGASIELSSGAAAGDGGAGGAAFAQVVELVPGAPSIVDSGESLADEDEDGVDDQPLPAAGSAHALSRAGGNGGSILVQAAGRDAVAFGADVSLRCGAGGATARASARGGKDASTVLEKPGAGGDVSLRWSGLTAAATGWDLVPGTGGDSGLLGAMSGAALAHDSASVKTAGGGEPGKAFVGATAVKIGAGGDSSNVSAQTDQDAKYDFGDAGSPETAGKPTAAQVP
jgi:hypothetical protein